MGGYFEKMRFGRWSSLNRRTYFLKPCILAQDFVTISRSLDFSLGNSMVLAFLNFEDFMLRIFNLINTFIVKTIDKIGMQLNLKIYQLNNHRNRFNPHEDRAIIVNRHSTLVAFYFFITAV